MTRRRPGRERALAGDIEIAHAPHEQRQAGEQREQSDRIHAAAFAARAGCHPGRHGDGDDAGQREERQQRARQHD